ncbi:uncharacterized protein LOC143450768 isoform X3 [Clavelina lepadiformis]|uniref:uncharacterized protein LOC143450768 isoform X3 n=1 Tax=Clavelina lepadiformis TaxID=159417 RepID=UPI004042E0DC
MLQAHGAGCVTPAAANVASLTTSQLAVGQLPSMQQLPQIRDPEWLKVEVCREFQRGACKRTADECRYAHPGKNIQVSADGKVIACFDALKGRCNRESCKYLHPTYQLKQQLEITGRQTLIQNRAMLQHMLPLQSNVMQATLPQGNLVGYEQVAGAPQASSIHANQLYSSQVAAAATAPAAAAYSVLQPSADLSALNPHIIPYYPIAASPGHQIFSQPTQVAAMVPTPGSVRADKLEVCRDFQRGNCTRGEFECRFGHPPDRSMIDVTDNTVTVCMDCIKGRCTREKCKYFHPPSHLQAKIRAAQSPAATFLPSLSPATIASPHQTVMTAQKRVLAIEDVMTNGTHLGQPPLKRHAIETSVITSAGSGIGTSPGLTSSSSNSQTAALAALYGYNNLTTMHHQAMQTAPAYYQQAVPMLQLQYGATAAGALNAAAPGHTTPFTAISFPTTSTSSANGTTTPYTLLNGQNQLVADAGTKPTVTQNSYGTSTLTVCRDFQSGKCSRAFCRFVHVHKDHVEIKDDRVTVCRNALHGKCTRLHCKFYHPPNTSPASPPQPQNGNILDPVYIDPAGSRVNGLSSNGVVGLLSSGVLPPAQHPYSGVLTEGSVQ